MPTVHSSRFTARDSTSDDNPLVQDIERILADPAPPLTEYQLIQALKQRGLVSADYSFSPLSLFRVHFLVFNALYSLQPVFAERNQALIISPLAIYLRPLEQGASAEALAELEDQPLREFYLDWDYYREATEESVEELLQKFWRNFARRGVVSDRERREALLELELEDPVTPADIKHQYRRLAMLHHPDRGGSEERLRRINAALAVLESGL